MKSNIWKLAFQSNLIHYLSNKLLSSFSCQFEFTHNLQNKNEKISPISRRLNTKLNKNLK